MNGRAPLAPVVQGLLAINEVYDAFVFDQYGVLHNGTSLYPNVLSVLSQLHEAGKQILVLTNSGGSAAYNLDRLEKMGIDPTLISRVVTSGDIAKDQVLPRYIEQFGANCYHIASPAEVPLSGLSGLSLTVGIEDCDFVYLSGMADGLAASWQTELLPRLRDLKVPLLCSNPDELLLQG